MAETFHPAQTIEVYCRFCKRIQPAQLDRSIAANGKTVSRESSFEYFCTKCRRSFCFTGTDLAEHAEEQTVSHEPRDYSPQLHYLIGDVVYHKKFKESGAVVSKESGSPACIVVNFEKSGMRKLVEDA
jgi:hypothetical protein